MDKKLQTKHKMITSLAQWQDVEHYFGSTSWVGLDTEFMREKTYYPQLCLVQLSSQEVEICLDPLEFDCSVILANLLKDKHITKIIHSASQDIEVLGYYCDCDIANLYDTQLAAEFSSLSSQMGYAALVMELLDVELPKSQTRSNWAKRPLTEKQIEYSFNDVTYLKPLYDAMNKVLANSEKIDWFEQEQANELERMLKFRVAPDSAYLNFKSSHRLAARNQQVLKQIVTWRETEAQKANRPKHWILTDKSIAEIGTKLPNDMDSLKFITRDDQRFNKRYLGDILKCIDAGLKQIDERVWQHRDQLTEPQKQQVNSLKRKIENLAFKLNLPVTRLATRKDIVEYVGDESGRLAQGWRHDVLNKMMK